MNYHEKLKIWLIFGRVPTFSADIGFGEIIGGHLKIWS